MYWVDFSVSDLNVPRDIGGNIVDTIPKYVSPSEQYSFRRLGENGSLGSGSQKWGTGLTPPIMYNELLLGKYVQSGLGLN